MSEGLVEVVKFKPCFLQAVFSFWQFVLHPSIFVSFPSSHSSSPFLSYTLSSPQYSARDWQSQEQVKSFAKSYAGLSMETHGPTFTNEFSVFIHPNGSGGLNCPS